MAARALTMRHSVHTERALCTTSRHSPRVSRGARAAAVRVHAMARNDANPPPLVKVRRRPLRICVGCTSHRHPSRPMRVASLAPHPCRRPNRVLMITEGGCGRGTNGCDRYDTSGGLEYSRGGIGRSARGHVCMGQGGWMWLGEDPSGSSATAHHDALTPLHVTRRTSVDGRGWSSTTVLVCDGDTQPAVSSLRRGL